MKPGPPKPSYSRLPWLALDLVAGLMTRESTRHEDGPPGSEGWRTLDVDAYIDAALRHLSAYRRGERDEAHLVHAAADLLIAAELWATRRP